MAKFMENIHIIKRITVFLVLGFIFFFGLGWISHRFAPLYPDMKPRVRQLMAKANSIEAITVGHSQGKAIDFRVMELNGYHLRAAGADMFETYYVLRHAVPILPNLKIVFIPVALCSLQYKRHSIKEWRLRNNGYYAAITSPALREVRLMRGRKADKLIIRIHDLVRQDHWSRVSKSAYHKLLQTRENSMALCADTEIQVDEYGSIRYYESMPYDSLVIEAEALSDKILRRIQDTVQECPDVEKDIYEVMVSIVDFLRERNIRPIFYTPPYTDLYIKKSFEKFPDSIELMTQNMERLKSKGGLEYYDFSQDYEFIETYEYFRDANHLNAYGAEKFSRKLWNVLIENGVCPDKDFITDISQ